MPKKPKHPCNYPGCAKLTEGRYCEEHQRLVDQNYNRYERDYTKKHERYGPLWQKIQAMYIREHPLCEQCLQEGRLVEAVHVHHKKPLAEGGTNEISNLIALCKPCHSRIHAKRGDRWHRNDQKTYEYDAQTRRVLDRIENPGGAQGRGSPNL